MQKKSGGLLTIFTLLILTPNIVLWTNSSINAFAVNLIGIAFVVALRQRLDISLLLLSPFAILAPLESFYILTYGHASDAHFLGVLSETNVHETTSLLNGISLIPVLLVLFPILLSALVIRQSFRENWQWLGRSRFWVLSAGTIVVLLFSVQDIPWATANNNINDPDNLIMGNADNSLTAIQLEKSYPVGIPFRIMDFLNQQEGLKQAKNLLKNFQFNASQTPQNTNREVYVLVIGETGRPDRWQLNGYSRPTTPRLAAMHDVTSLSNVTTGWAWTRMSVPVIITRKPANNASAFFAEKSLVTAFREAGFKTYWFSVQGPLGLHESSIALHAHEAHETRFLNPADYKGSGSHDSALLAPLEEALARNEPKQLIVLHTLGSHYNYADRYPSDFDVFKPSLTTIESANMYDRTQKEAMSNSYDNSILYTDYVLAEIIERLKSTTSQSALLYTADHGENLFDGDCDKSGHGHATEHDFRVASLWWNSTSYAQSNPQKVAHIRERQSAPLTTEHVFYTLLDAANIHYPNENTNRSLLSNTWKPHPRWTQGGLDFDTSTRDPVCKTLVPKG